MNKKNIFHLFLCLAATNIFSIANAQNPKETIFDEIILSVDTNIYRLSELTEQHHEANLFPFLYRHENELAELRLIPKSSYNSELIDVYSSPGINVVQFKEAHPEKHFLIYFQFENITRGNFFNLTAAILLDNHDTVYQQISLQPVTLM